MSDAERIAALEREIEIDKRRIKFLVAKLYSLSGALAAMIHLLRLEAIPPTIKRVFNQTSVSLYLEREIVKELIPADAYAEYKASGAYTHCDAELKGRTAREEFAKDADLEVEFIDLQDKS